MRRNRLPDPEHPDTRLFGGSSVIVSTLHCFGNAASRRRYISASKTASLPSLFFCAQAPSSFFGLRVDLHTCASSHLTQKALPHYPTSPAHAQSMCCCDSKRAPGSYASGGYGRRCEPILPTMVSRSADPVTVPIPVPKVAPPPPVASSSTSVSTADALASPPPYEKCVGHSESSQ